MLADRHYHPALAGAPPEEGNWNHLGRLFPTCLPQAGMTRRQEIR